MTASEPHPVRSVPKVQATIIAIATYVIVAGIFTQSGVILGPAATYFHSSVTDTAVLFSYLNAGNLGGITASLFAFPLLTIRQALFAAYIMFFGGIALIAGTHALHVAFAAVVLIGLGSGTGLSTGAVIISKLYTDRRRAITFLGTDCAFSGAGYVFPSLVGVLIAAGWNWQSGYVLVAVLPALVLIAAIRIRFPSVRRVPERHGDAAPEARSTATSASEARATIAGSSYLRVGLFAAGLTLYLTGQNIFTIWSPTYLQTHFGVPAAQAGGIVGTFYGASSFGLITAALLVTRLAPRAVLACSITLGAGLSLLLALAPTVGLFFGLTLAFGFTSTCMFKLMISIGSEQIPSSPPALVTFLLFCSGVGGIVAPAISAPVVKSEGIGASLLLGSSAYAGAFVLVVAALLIERRARARRSRLRDATAA